MGLLGNYSEPNVGYLSVSILGSNHGVRFFSRTAMQAEKRGCNGPVSMH